MNTGSQTWTHGDITEQKITDLNTRLLARIKITHPNTRSHRHEHWIIHRFDRKILLNKRIADLSSRKIDNYNLIVWWSVLRRTGHFLHASPVHGGPDLIPPPLVTLHVRQPLAHPVQHVNDIPVFRNLRVSFSVNSRCEISFINMLWWFFFFIVLFIKLIAPDAISSQMIT